MSKKFFYALAVAAFMAGNVFAAGSEVVDQTLAVVNGEPIFTSEYNAVIVPTIEMYKQRTPQAEQSEAGINELRNAVLNQKIDEVLLKQEVKKQKIKVSKKEIQDGIDQIKNKFANESEFNAELKRENMSMGDFEKKITEQISVMKLVRQSVDSKVKAPTEADVKAFYDKVVIKMKGGEAVLSKEDDELASNLAVFLKRISGEQVRLRQIFIACPKGASSEEVKAALARVNAVKKAIAGGEGFAEVAGKYTEDSASKSRNGDMGMVAKGDLLPVIDKEVFKMNVGEYTKEPIKTDSGYHFLRVEEKRASKDFTFDEVKNDIGELMYRNEAMKTYNNWLAGLRSKADIKINKTW